MNKKTDIKVRRKKIYVIGGVLLFVLVGLFVTDKITRRVSDSNISTFRSAIRTKNISLCNQISGPIRHTATSNPRMTSDGAVLEGSPTFSAMSEQEAKERCRKLVRIKIEG